MFRFVVFSFAGISLWGQSDFAAQFERIKREATPAQLYAFLYAMPKGGDLHHHGTLAAFPEEWLAAATDPAVTQGNTFFTRIRFNACPDSPEPFLRYQTIARYAYRRLSMCVQEEYGQLDQLSAERRTEWLNAMRLDKPGEGRDEFFEQVVNRLFGLIRDPNVLSEVMARYIKRYGREGIRYLETQVGLIPGADQEGNPYPPDRIGEVMRKMLDRPDVKASGVTVRFQITVIRFRPDAEQRIEETYAFLNKNRDLFVGINLAGREDNDKGHPLRFLETFRKMRRRYSGIHMSIHAGEVDAPGTQVRDTLLIGAERIGHGLNLITDPDTLVRMRDQKQLVEINLISNRVLEYFPDLNLHPFPEYLRTGVPVCLNTDDPGVWDSNLTDEYFTAVKLYDLTWPEIRRMGRDSLRYSFASDETKRLMLANFKIAMGNFEAKFGKDWALALNQVRPEVSGYARHQLFSIKP
jgi:adenosine deaminase CECR1